MAEAGLTEQRHNLGLPGQIHLQLSRIKSHFETNKQTEETELVSNVEDPAVLDQLVKQVNQSLLKPDAPENRGFKAFHDLKAVQLREGKKKPGLCLLLEGSPCLLFQLQLA